MFKKMQNFMLISNPLKQFLKICTKSYEQNKFDKHDKKRKEFIFLTHFC